MVALMTTTTPDLDVEALRTHALPAPAPTRRDVPMNEGRSHATVGQDEGLRIEGLRKAFGSIHAVRDMTLHIPRGKMVGFLGPNGAGKTTTMRSIVGMVRPDAGSITWRGRPLDLEATRRIGYMPQERGLYPRMKVSEQLIYMARLAGLERGDAIRRTTEWMERLGVADRANDPVSDLSGGNQQRVQLASALVHEPELLVLDEPFAGLDPVATMNLREVIDEQAAAGVAVLFSSHQLGLVADLCDDVIIVNDGQNLASGRIEDLRKDAPRRRLLLRWDDGPRSWTPSIGTVLRSKDDLWELSIERDADVAGLLAAALEHGPLSEIRFEPPDLEEIFAGLVTSPATTSNIDTETQEVSR